MVVEVTQADINYGRKGSYTSCPIAAALFRATGQRYYVFGTVVAPASCIWVKVFLPEVASSFARNFDLGHTVEPFSFELEV